MNIIEQHDGYKADHASQFPEGTEYVYSNFTARGPSRVPGIDGIVFFGLQRFVVKRLMDDFNNDFFGNRLSVGEYKRRLDNYLGKGAVNTKRIGDLHNLGYLPIRIKALPEGSVVPFQVPAVTIENTHPDFAWLTNFLETMLSAELWPTCTSATLAHKYRQVFDYYADKTGADKSFVQWQGHDFSMRGMFGIEAAAMSGMGHLLSFTGTDTIPAITELEEYYLADSDKELIGGSVPATEHAVMCANGKETELETYSRLLDVYPTGIVSVVSDTWDFWNVVTKTLPALKDKIMARNGKLVIRPDSGVPEDILCGDEKAEGAARKGLIECLWETFGGTMTDKGYKVLDSHIGAIYGDSITLQRQEEILRRLAAKGFASSNVVLGIGSYTYQFVSRDTFGFAMKATNCVINGVETPIFKQPKTDSGKNSHKGLLQVELTPEGFVVNQNVTRDVELTGALEIVFENGNLMREQSLADIRSRLNDRV